VERKGQMKRKYYTLCDYLIEEGVPFQPDAVVFNAMDTVEDDRPVTGQYGLPPFDNSFVDVWLPVEHGHNLIFGVLFSRVLSAEGHAFHTIAFGLIKGSPYQYMVSQSSVMVYGDDGRILSPVEQLDISRKRQYPLQEPHGGFTSFSFVDEHNIMSMPQDIANAVFRSAARAFTYIHRKNEVDLVSLPRQRRRKIKREQGKEPSPYFWIKAPQKSRASKGRVTGLIRPSKAHMVRGHFRVVENHPIEQFNGTHWIPAHTRGNNPSGEPIQAKNYQIVMLD
jgi:hypothetical protein